MKFNSGSLILIVLGLTLINSTALHPRQDIDSNEVEANVAAVGEVPETPEGESSEESVENLVAEDTKGKESSTKGKTSKHPKSSSKHDEVLDVKLPSTLATKSSDTFSIINDISAKSIADAKKTTNTENKKKLLMLKNEGMKNFTKALIQLQKTLMLFSSNPNLFELDGGKNATSSNSTAKAKTSGSGETETTDSGTSQ
ncbi:hypothetical protein BB560_000533 [Smittium megazygosporum]|uniref:Uncharacterized protein n=1 Tax=Smittium megazygosporum TaxID=133381 RepID=A0A2T9ZK10_9FUNG|nr:hypothetical protein BB560_000533 [Smittium megazygosporum]